MKRICQIFLSLCMGTLAAEENAPFCSPFTSNNNINQTATLSPIHDGSELPYEVSINTLYTLPAGVHSFASATDHSDIILIGGRTNGLHGFNADDNNFPPSAQNTNVFVVNPSSLLVQMRSLNDPSSGLTQEQIDLLSVTSPQSYQVGDTLYITGGYGVDSATGQFSTKDVLTAINVPLLKKWVIEPSAGVKLSDAIRQISDPIFKVTGGYMTQIENGPTLLVFGQDFQGFYSAKSNGLYTEKVRRFKIYDDGKHLSIKKLSSKPGHKRASYRRRDLNVVPVLISKEGEIKEKLIAFSGVFTIPGGIWTVPVEISKHGKPKMADPAHPKTFKQGMNNYVTATAGLFSEKKGAMYNLFFGGISYGFYQNGVFTTDSEIPFINQVTTIKINDDGKYKQYLMDAEYPFIPVPNSSTGFLFGAGSEFFSVEGIKTYPNGVIKYDELPIGTTVIGYIVGGIQSKLPNTNTMADSGASPYVFVVTITRKE